MDKFVLFRQHKAVAAHFEATLIWEQRGYAVPDEGSSMSCAESAVPPPGSEVPPTSKARCSKYAERDLLKFMETRLLYTDVLYADES